MPAFTPLTAPLAALFAAIALSGFPGGETALNESRRGGRSPGQLGLPPGCLYEGHWFTEGAAVSTGEACLHCACSRGALTCRRLACAALPDPPPHRCHVLHRRGSCCPELHCPDGIIMMEHSASARFENEEDINAPVSIAHVFPACVEGGTVYAAGSAMRSTVACEQCFCLGGARRCVRLRCLPPPPGCKPRPAPGACCPQRYYCEHRTTKPPEEKHPHDCKVDGKWISEGEKVVSKKTSSNCTQCFCLRGAVQCQPLSCAPPLLGCKPLLRPGECCAHQYHCGRPHQEPSMPQFLGLTSNALTSARNDHQAIQNPLPSKKEAATKTTLASIYLVKNTRITSATNNLVSTTKVKRKTSDPPPPVETSSPPSQNTTEVTPAKTTEEPTTVAKLMATTESTPTTEHTTETTSTEQPEGSVRITINGTINCTAELSSTSLPLNVTFNDTDRLEKITLESHPRIPLIDVSNLEDHTFSPNDIITDRSVNSGFDENESFVINVTSSLRTNTSHASTTKPPTVKPTPIVTKVSIPTDIAEALNSSKKTKGDYDYDYTEQTLPPSLPNLKIIPFVAADAVVENERPKETSSFPNHEREDKFPVYYPSIDPKDTSFTRREDVYHSTQYPVFITDKGEEEQYPSLIQDVDLTSTGYSNAHNDLSTSGNVFTVSASLGSRISEKAVTQSPVPTTTYIVEAPAVNRFSPPVETEGGFVPKGPSGLIDEYYAVFPSTPSGPAVPHLTTSMQLDIAKEECVSRDGHHIPEGNTINLACSECTCAWGELHCSPHPCHTPPGCRRRPASSNSADLCCGELICDEDNKPTPTPEISIEKQSTTPESISMKDTANISKNVSVYNPPIVNITNTKTYASTHQIENVFKKPIYQNQNDSKMYTVDKAQVETTQNFTAATTETIKQFTFKQLPTTTKPGTTKQPEHEDQPLEYEEEEDDGSFSFGNVLKLLLSDSYETTTAAPKRLSTTPKLPPAKLTTTTKRSRPTLPQVPRPTVAPFVPMPLHPFIPPKISQNHINRIDHLVLGEATAIKRTTLRPEATSTRIPPSTRPATIQTTQKTVTKPTEVTRKEEYTTTESPRPPGGLPGLGPGLLKLAGCNIYGQMYRVGRIIAELSTPCQECWCTEFGVQCKQLKC